MSRAATAEKRADTPPSLEQARRRTRARIKVETDPDHKQRLTQILELSDRIEAETDQDRKRTLYLQLTQLQAIAGFGDVPFSEIEVEQAVIAAHANAPAPAPEQPVASEEPSPTAPIAEQIAHWRPRYNAETSPTLKLAIAKFLFPLELAVAEAAQRTSTFTRFQHEEQRRSDHQALRLVKWRGLESWQRAAHIAVMHARREASERRERVGTPEMTPARALRLFAEAGLQDWSNSAPPDFFMEWKDGQS